MVKLNAGLEGLTLARCQKKSFRRFEWSFANRHDDRSNVYQVGFESQKLVNREPKSVVLVVLV